MKVLDFGDVLLHESDVDLLRGPYWLNDQVIAFYFEWLSRERLKQLPPHATPSLLPGAITFLLLNSSADDAQAILAPLKVNERPFVVLAINDNPHIDMANGGSHWSLLVYERSSNTFRHYDSASPSNRKVAARVAKAMGPAVTAAAPTASLAPPQLQPQQQAAAQAAPAGTGACGAPSCPAPAASLQAQQPAAPAAQAAPALVEVTAMPRQRNGYDCGVYACCVAGAACELALKCWQQQQQQQVQAAPGGSQQVEQQQHEQAQQQQEQREQGQQQGEEECQQQAAASAAPGGGLTEEEQRLREWLTPAYVGDLRRSMLRTIEDLAQTQGQRTADKRQKVGPGK